MEVRNSSFAAFIDVFTQNTYVMVIMSDLSIRKSVRLLKCHVEGSVTQRRNSILPILRKSGLFVTEDLGLKELSVCFTSH